MLLLSRRPCRAQLLRWILRFRVTMAHREMPRALNGMAANYPLMGLSLQLIMAHRLLRLRRYGRVSNPWDWLRLSVSHIGDVAILTRSCMLAIIQIKRQASHGISMPLFLSWDYNGCRLNTLLDGSGAAG